MKKIKKNSLIIVFLIVILFGFNNLIKTFLSNTNVELPIKIGFPTEYKSLFNSNVQTRIRHVYSEIYKKQVTFPVSFVKIDSFHINIFKYRCPNSFLNLIHIDTNKSQRGRMISNYYSIGSLDIDMLYRNNLTKKIDTLYIRSTKPIDTLLFNKNIIILKGTMGNLEIKVDKSKQGADQYFDDETYLKKSPKYYLVWIQKNGYLYELFIETKRFDDKKIISLFE